MGELFWQAKIWGLLHDPALKALHDNTGRGGSSFWRDLTVMQDWKSRGWDPNGHIQEQVEAIKYISLADQIASASDRGAIGSLDWPVDYDENGLEVSHLLSEAKLPLKLTPQQAHDRLLQEGRARFLKSQEEYLFPAYIKESTDLKKVFWWLWRCLPKRAFNKFANDEKLLLMPAETRLPDSSIWSHTTITSALAGSLTGYDLTVDDLGSWSEEHASRPYLVTFTFTPVQELVKASRKMRDFWAGSWILHYLSAKVCWALAWKYGPDSLVYPSLFQQPLIDHWLLNGSGDFPGWKDDFGGLVDQPSDQKLLTAGFPNVLVLVLPEAKVRAAMQMAEQTLRQEWKSLGDYAFEYLKTDKHWLPQAFNSENVTWEGWLSSIWQTYWTALPIGARNEPLCAPLTKPKAENKQEKDKELVDWLKKQNFAYSMIQNPDLPLYGAPVTQYKTDRWLLQPNEGEFLRSAVERSRYQYFSINVGSWWPYIFDQVRLSLNAIKNARSWELPTTFSARSSISGLGPVVYADKQGQPDNKDWVSEGASRQFWQSHAGLFDGSEQLNATETVKRVLPKILQKILNIKQNVSTHYPDLTAGVAGYLKVSERCHLNYFHQTCVEIQKRLEELQLEEDLKIDIQNNYWGIPWLDNPINSDFQGYHSRYLKPDWLVETSDRVEGSEAVQKKLQSIKAFVSSRYGDNDPASWYVLAVGDGDGMSEWLKGKLLKNYCDYIPEKLKEYCDPDSETFQKATPEDREFRKKFEKILNERKRMGPATHAALSRALLDFSNQLVPYLTEQRYAGRLIYSGGDDVLAYTNLWEWDAWLWDIRQCFKGDKDPHSEFDNTGDYWRWRKEVKGEPPDNVSPRPLFTMGRNASISFGVVIAHHSVPLAIALENLWEAEKPGAKEYGFPDGKTKDAVQVRVLYGNGNILKSTAKFDTFNQWRSLLTSVQDLEPALFEQAAQIWEQHPVPLENAIQPWVNAFCDRRDFFKANDEGKQRFNQCLVKFLEQVWETTLEADHERDRQIQNWLKLAAFVLRKRDIQIGGV
ncbi:MAG: type III-B CRISPR-associated protein Cas10/Cmr2 [Nodosilinea sp.]